MPIVRTSLVSAALAVCAVLAAGCATQFDYVELNPDPGARVARPARTVEIFTSPPPRPHVDLRVIHILTATGPEETLAELRTEAERLGCDALFAPHVSGGNMRATCVRYAEPQPSSE